MGGRGAHWAAGVLWGSIGSLRILVLGIDLEDLHVLSLGSSLGFSQGFPQGFSPGFFLVLSPGIFFVRRTLLPNSF